MVVASRTKELRIIGEVSPLFAQLEAVEFLAAKYKRDEDAPSTSSTHTDTQELIESIKVEIHSVAGIFRKLEIWEREMKGKIEDVAKVIDGALQVSKSQDELHSKLLTVIKEAAACGGILKAKDSPIRLERLEDFVNSLSYSTEPLPFVIRPPSSSADHHVDQYGKLLQFDTAKSVADLKTDIESCRNDRILWRISHGQPHLEVILNYLSILPSGSLIKKTAISYFTTLVYSSLRLASADSVDEILENLLRYGIIRCRYKDHRPRVIDSCTVHPLAREALSILARESLSKPRYDPWSLTHANRICDPQTLRSYLLPAERIEVTSWGRDVAYVNINHRYLKFSRNTLDAMRQSCEVLLLGRLHGTAEDHHIEIANAEFINWVGSLARLKCLSLRGVSRITEIPSSFGKLRDLQILDLRACYDLQRLPLELSRLWWSLEHLDVSECYFLTHMPKGVASLTELRVLKGFVVGSPGRPDSCQLGDLSELSSLEKLSIRMARDAVLEEEQFGRLSCLRSLVSLTITWSVSGRASPCTSSTALTVNEGAIVSPPPNLEKLDLRCIPHITRPPWLDAMKLRKLKRIYIRAGNLDLHSLCESDMSWDSVQVIRIRYVQGVNQTEVDEGLRRAFPSLDYLEFHKCNDSSFDYLWTSPRHQEETARRQEEIRML